MHSLGKFFLALVALMSIGSFYLTTKSLEVRSAWQKEAQRLEKQLADEQIKLDANRLSLSKLTSEFNRMIHPWRSYWTGVKVSQQPGEEATGSLLIELGLPKLPQPDPQVVGGKLLLHAFQPIAGGSENLYVGEFRVEQLGEGQSVLVPNWLLMPGESQHWVMGDQWHFREAIPAGDLALTGALETQLALGLERLNTRQAELLQTEQIIEKTNDVLKRRVGEIEGIENPTDKLEKLPPEFVLGLLQTIQDEESAVNTVSAEVQQLRDRLYDVQKQFDNLLATIQSELNRLQGLGNEVQASLTPAP